MYLKNILPLIKPYKGSFLMSLFFNILYALFGTLSFVSISPVINVIFGSAKYRLSPPVYENYESMKEYGEDYLNYFITYYTNLNGKQYVLFVFIVLIVTLFLFKNISNYYMLFFNTRIKNFIAKDLRAKIYQKIISLPYSKFQKTNKGDLVTRMSSDVVEVHDSIVSLITMFFRDPMSITFTLITMFWISAKLTLFMFIFIPVSGLIISLIGKRLKKASINVQNEMGRFLSIFDETLGGIKIIKSFNAQSRFKNKFDDSLDLSRKLSNKMMYRRDAAGPTSEFLGILVIGVLLWYGGRMVLVEKSITGSLFITYMGLSYNILTPAKNISKSLFTVKKGAASLSRILEILNIDVSDYYNSKDDIQKVTFDEKIEFIDVNFKYDKHYVLNNFFFEVKKGENVAIVGRSGGGKSTITTLLNRFYDHQEGSIRIDNVDIKDLKLETLRSMIGLVTQDQILFNDTVKGNLLIGNPEATDEDIKNALEHANAFEFVTALEKGLDTMIEYNGSNLSGGQKQRLCIARALIKNPPILILDEATSSLDAESEKHVQKALDNIMKERTSIVIAHRLSTIQNADKIVVIEDGKILEIGTHQELIKLNGYYSNLVKLQTG